MKIRAKAFERMMNECPLCKNSMILVNSHHIVPQAAGGSSGPVIDVCAQCHDGIHQCAIKVLAGKSAEANHIADNMFTNKKLAYDLIQSVVQATLKKREGQVSEKDFDYKLLLVFPGTSKKYLKILAKEARMSIVNYVTELIMREIRKRFKGD